MGYRKLGNTNKAGSSIMLNTLIETFGYSALILSILSWDNILWISGSGADYEMYKKLDVRGKIQYIFHYRIKTVFTNWRDIIAAITGGFFLALVV